MEENTLELINKLLEICATQKQQPYEHTFLEAIGRSRDEVTISRLLGFILKNDEDLCRALFVKYAKKNGCKWDLGDLPVPSVELEKRMYNGRADIFIEAGNYTLTIENKIDSFENGEQTDKYFGFVDDYYKDKQNGFIYLKPENSKSKPKNKNFVEMTYAELLQLIEESGAGDKFEEDFKNHIQNHLINRGVNMTETDLKILNNYKLIKELVDSAESQFKKAKENVEGLLLKGNIIGQEEIKDWTVEQREGVFVADNSRGKDDYYRISKNKVWWNVTAPDDQKFYFYLELHIGAPDYIMPQMTIRNYGKSTSLRMNSNVYKFVECEKNSDEGMKYGNWDDEKRHHFVSSPRGKFESKAKLFSDEWMNELQVFLKDVFNEYLRIMEIWFAKFNDKYHVVDNN